MVHLKKSEISLIENFVSWPRGFGYVLDYSDRTFAEFFEDEFRVEIYNGQYEDRGGSKRHHLVAFCLKEPASIVIRVLGALLDERNRLKDVYPPGTDDNLEDRFASLIATIEAGADQPRTDALYHYEQDRTLDELIADLERTIGQNKPEAALDHLHTYCMKKFAYLLSLRDVDCDHRDALHARFGKYRKLILEEMELQVCSDLALKSAISIFQKFNDVRNNRSLAHDNEILAYAEARYVFDSITALLRFIRSIEAGRFEITPNRVPA